jgi:4-hydroxy-tetrahydrodipicolinate reductase
MTIKAFQYGVGPIGASIVTSANRRGAEFVGALDVDPAKTGRDLGEIAGLDRDLGVAVEERYRDEFDDPPNITYHATGSSLRAVSDQLKEVMNAGSNVITTAEEAIYPWRTNERLASELDAVARENGVTCLGTGINPGFVMDTLPLVLSAPLESVDEVEMLRVQDAARRRKPLQEKVGAGLDEAQFAEQIVRNGGHVGSTESIALVASALGWEIDDIEETTEPVVADRYVCSEYVEAREGDVAGVRQVAKGIRDGSAVISIDLRMYLEAERPRDEISIDGDPPISVEVVGGYHGDTSTAAIIANTTERVVQADPGLQSMVDIALPSHTTKFEG